MTNIFEMFETDDLLETGGIWIDYGEAGKFLVARQGGANTKFSMVLEAKMRPHRTKMDKKTMPIDLADQVLRETFVEACLLGWEGIKGRDGKEIKFSKAAANKLFEDLPDLFNDLREQAGEMNNFKVGEIEADAGN